MSSTAATPSGRNASGALLLVAVLVIAANMRITISGVGPLLEQIREDTGYPVTTLGVLTSVPLVMWAIFSPFAHRLSRGLGLNATVSWSLLVLALATILRSLVLPGEAGLWLGTIVTGVALAVANVLMPAVIKRDFGGRIAGVTSAFTVLLALVGASASGFIVPVSHLAIGEGVLGWRTALLLTGSLLPFAIAFWMAATRRLPHSADIDPTPVVEPVETTGSSAQVVPTSSTTGATIRNIWRDPVAWLVAAYMGLQAVQFYIMLAWLSPLSISVGTDETVAGLQVMTLQIVGMVATPFVPRLLRSRLGRVLPGLLAIPAIIGAVGLMLWPQGAFLWVVFIGLSSGPSLSVALTLVAVRAPDHSVATALSGMSQSVGYGLAAIGPILFGWFHDLTGAWILSLALLVVLLLALLVVGILVGRSRQVFAER